jgi:FMN phosphatase YigB (HAD superfamily)
MPNQPIKKILITDLDNTLFDWVGLWYACFAPMMQKIAEIAGIDREQLKPHIKAVHQKHGTSEYAFLLEELQPVIAPRSTTARLLDMFAPAVDVFRENRRKHLALYPTVAETLLKVRGAGAMLIGYTESMGFYSNYRVRRLGLDGVFHELFSPRDHDIPRNMTREQIRKYPAAHYELKFTKHSHTPTGSLKPDAVVLRAIIDKVGGAPEECVYVGDSLFKDVPMAQQVGVADVWAKYGEAQHKPEYTLLREVTHWTAADVQRETKFKAQHVNPSIILHHSFSELLTFFRFGDAHVD